MKLFGSKLLLLGVGVGVGVLALGSTVLARPPSPEPAPVPVPFSTGCVIDSFNPGGNAQCAPAPVPVGFRFEIQTVSAQLTLDTPGVKPIMIHSQVRTGGNVQAYYFPATFQGVSQHFSGDFYTMNQEVRLYADGGSVPLMTVTASDTTTAFIDISLSGMLVPE